MPAPHTPPQDFREILKTIWWKLDRVLDAETISFSALAGSLEAARCGVTTLIDHHSSPGAVGGSLELVKNALQKIGIRGVLCYETSDRDGLECRDEALAENERFLETHRSDHLYRGLVGGHASFTLSDDSLKKIGDLAERFDTGVHLHLAEDQADPQLTESQFRRKILDRLAAYGILGRKSVFAHCIHLTPAEFARLRESAAWLIHNPRSNMNNRVGHAPLDQFGSRKALGTDGFPPDMMEELRAGYLRNREVHSEAEEDPVSILNNGQRLISEIFGRDFGVIQQHALADLLVIDYSSPTPLKKDNFTSHFLFGFRSSMVESVMVNGRWILKERTFPEIDEDEILQGARKASQKLWSAVHALRP